MTRRMVHTVNNSGKTITTTAILPANEHLALASRCLQFIGEATEHRRERLARLPAPTHPKARSIQVGALGEPSLDVEGNNLILSHPGMVDGHSCIQIPPALVDGVWCAVALRKQGAMPREQTPLELARMLERMASLTDKQTNNIKQTEEQEQHG